MDKYIYRILVVELNNGEKFYEPQCKRKWVLSFLSDWETISYLGFIGKFHLNTYFNYTYKTNQQAENIIEKYKKHIIDNEIKSITIKTNKLWNNLFKC